MHSNSLLKSKDCKTDICQKFSSGVITVSSIFEVKHGLREFKDDISKIMNSQQKNANDMKPREKSSLSN